MMMERRVADRGFRACGALAPAMLAGFLLLACAPEQRAGDDGMDAAESPATAETASGEAAGTAQDAPACRFTASGDELTQRASPPDSASARLDGGTAKICYGAPSVRDREIMGGLVPYGEPWRMGANEPTTLHLTAAARVGNVQVEPGSYALYAIPGESEWSIVLNSDPERWGIPINEEVRANDVGSFTVQPERMESPVERMRIQMEGGDGQGARVTLEWENTRVSFPVTAVGSEG